MNKLVTLISEKDIKKRVKELAKEIEKDFKGEDITFICILKGSIHFFSDIEKQLIEKHSDKIKRYYEAGASTKACIITP